MYYTTQISIKECTYVVFVGIICSTQKVDEATRIGNNVNKIPYSILETSILKLRAKILSSSEHIPVNT